MRLLLKLGWRNLWRNKRRSVITILAVTFAVMLSIVMRGIQLGTYEVNIRHVVDLFTGHVQIQAPGYQDSPSLRKSFAMSREMQAILAEDPRIVAFAPRVLGDGLVSFRQNSQGALLFGIDPQAERKVSSIESRVVQGAFIDTLSSSGVLLGTTLLENLNARIGDEIVVLAQGFDGSLGNLKFSVAGVVKTGMLEIDRSAAFMHIDAARDLLLMYGRVTMIAVRLEDLQSIEPVEETLSAQLAPLNLDALTWSEVMPGLQQGIEMDNVSGILTLAILVIVVAFGITNTVLMSITERFREFGIVLSVGMAPRMLVGIVLLETAIMVTIGIIIGNILAYGVNTYLVANPIVFEGEFGKIYEEYGFLPRIESTVQLKSFLNNTLSILGVSILAAIYPVLKVARLEPLKGIRYT
ncbi:MAG TPA: FtsX-like permease family protein [Bacteroidota bacterium]